MSKSREEIEVWLKDFSRQQEERKENDQEWDFELVVPQAILDLLPEWESDTWEEIDWWLSLEEEIQGKTGLPFEEIRDFYC